MTHSDRGYTHSLTGAPQLQSVVTNLISNWPLVSEKKPNGLLLKNDSVRCVLELFVGRPSGFHSHARAPMMCEPPCHGIHYFASGTPQIVILGWAVRIANHMSNQLRMHSNAQANLKMDKRPNAKQHVVARRSGHVRKSMTILFQCLIRLRHHWENHVSALWNIGVPASVYWVADMAGIFMWFFLEDLCFLFSINEQCLNAFDKKKDNSNIKNNWPLIWFHSLQYI